MSQQLANGKQQFIDGNGNPLAGGSVAFYLPGTLTPTNTWQDPALTTLNANPVVLDALGMASIWGADATQYRQVVQDALGNTIWDKVVGLATLATASSVAAVQEAVQEASYTNGADSGAANAYAINLVPAPGALTPGMMVAIDNILATNTGASTLNVNGLGALPIQHPGGIGLQGGEFVAGYGAVLRLNHAGTAWTLLASTGIEGIPKSSVQNFNSGSVNLGFNNNNLTSMTANVVMPSYSRTGKFRFFGRVITATTFTSSTGSWTFNAGVLDTTNSNAQLAGDGKSKYIQSGGGTDDSQFFMSPYQYSPGQTVPLTVQFASNGAGTVSFQTVEVMIVEA